MKKIVYFLAIVCFHSFLISYETIDGIEKILPEVGSDTFVVLDIDNTLIRTTQQLGSDQWARFELKRLVDKGMDKEKATKRVDIRWAKIQRKTKLETVEKQTINTLLSLKEKKATIMGLSSRFSKHVDLTCKQLAKVKIDLTLAAPTKEIIRFTQEEEIRYQNGILFVGQKNEKGNALAAFLDKMQMAPSKIVFVDDRLDHVQAFEEAFKEGDIECKAYHYLAGQEWVDAFDPSITDLQWKFFQTVMSDKDAKILTMNPDE